MSQTWKCDRCGAEISHYQSDKHHVYICNPNTVLPVTKQLFGCVPLEDMDLCDNCMKEYGGMITLFLNDRKCI